MFALWLAARPKIPPSSDLYVKDPLPVRAVFALAPAPNIEQLHQSGVCQNVIDKLMGGSPAERSSPARASSVTRRRASSNYRSRVTSR